MSIAEKTMNFFMEIMITKLHFLRFMYSENFRSRRNLRYQLIYHSTAGNIKHNPARQMRIYSILYQDYRFAIE